MKTFFSLLAIIFFMPLLSFAQTVTLSTSPVAASNIAQGTSNNIVYVVKMDVAALPVTANSISFTLTGTHDNNDLTTVNIYFNPVAPTISGGALTGGSGLFAAPHTYTLGMFQTIAAGASGYFIIAVNTAATATNGNTIKVNGTANPVVFGFTTAPTITNNQTNIAGTQTILGAGVTLTSSPVAAANIAQGTNSNIVYIVKMDVVSLPVSVNSIQFTLTGTHDNNDLTTAGIWFNPSAPSLSGATPLTSVSGLFAAPHTYTAVIIQNIAAGASGYFIITVNTAAAATTGNTVKINGLANPAIFGFSTAPAITNNQTDIAGTQTILGAGVTLTSSPVAATNIAQGTNNNIAYIVKMDVVSLPVSVNSIQFTLTGTHDNNDLTTAGIWFNPSAPSLSGATPLTSVSGLFAAPHTYTAVIIQNIAAGASGYFIITVNTDVAATTGNTIKVNGLANPAIFSFATAPPVTNNQTDAAGIKTIGSTLPLTLLSFTANVNNTQEVQLQWKTAGELNTKDFEVEWSNDELHFSKIAVIQAAGNSTQNMHYPYLHKLPADGNNYYRLKIRDIDGGFTYSPVIKINVVVTKVKIAVFPNPVIDFVNLQVQSLKNEAILFYLHSADGKTVATKSFGLIKGINLLSWSLQKLAPGNYFISAVNKYFKTIKIIKH